MKTFKELLYEIIDDIKKIHIAYSNNKYCEINIFSKIAALFQIVTETKNYTANNLKCIESLHSLYVSYFMDDGFLYPPPGKYKEGDLEYQYFKYYYLTLLFEKDNSLVSYETKKEKTKVSSNIFYGDKIYFDNFFQDFLNRNNIKIVFREIDIFEYEAEVALLLNNDPNSKVIQSITDNKAGFSKLYNELLEKIHYVKLFSEKRITEIEFYDFKQNVAEWLRMYLLFENYHKKNFKKLEELQKVMDDIIHNIINDEDSTFEKEESQSINITPCLELILEYYSQLMNHTKDFPLLKNEVFKKVIADLYPCFIAVDKAINDSSEFWDWEPAFSNYTQNESEKTKNEKKESVLDLTERSLIIALLQKHQLFPKHSTRQGQTQKMMDDFVSVLLNENIDSIEKARKKIDVFFDLKQITSSQKPFKLKNLNNIKPYFESLGKPEIISEIELMITNIDKI